MIRSLATPRIAARMTRAAVTPFALWIALATVRAVAEPSDPPAPPAEVAAEAAEAPEKQIIGATAAIKVVDGGLTFPARVDTGATTSSLHVEEWSIKDRSDSMAENVGKVIRFCIKNHEGEIEWLERKIVELSTIKTSVQEEQRYKVNITLAYRGVEKKVLVSLKDRSHMEYPLLLGRNFLEGDFIVDVEKSPTIAMRKLRPDKTKTQVAANRAPTI